MAWDDVRRLVLPTALTVTSLSVALACGGEETSKNEQSQVQCSTITSGPCQKCLTPDAGVGCAPTTSCYYDPGSDKCYDGVA